VQLVVLVCSVICVEIRSFFDVTSVLIVSHSLAFEIFSDNCRNVDWNFQHVGNSDGIHSACSRRGANRQKCKYHNLVNQ